MTAQRTEEQQALAELVSSWARENAAPRAADDEARAQLPRDLFDGLGRLDLAGLPFDEEHGGGGQPYGVYLEVLEELARAHVVLALTLSVHTLSSWILLTYGRPELREDWGSRAATGAALGAYSLSEPGSGSDAAALVTRAESDGDSYVLTGTKAWVSHAPDADFFVVMARTGEHKSRGISAFLVPAGSDGLSVAAPERKMGMAASPTCQLLLDGVRVPASHLLGDEGQGFRIALAGLDGGRLGIAACATGLAQAALEQATAYAREREQFGRPIAEFQGVSFLLADMATGVAAARALYREAAARRDHGLPHVRDAAMAKLFATDTAMRVTTDAVQVFGGYGYTREFPVERFMREAKVMQIFEGTNQIQRVVIARDLLAAR
jgi:alkylation response protein AidB-like acyl-CoA dehydrogenase